jgi:hypothetical protein
MKLVHSAGAHKPSATKRSARRARKLAPSRHRGLRLQKPRAQEDGTDPFLLAREYSNQDERDHAGQLTLRYWRGEWFQYRQGRYVRVDEGTIRVELTAFVKCYYDENGVVDRNGNVLKVTKGHIANVLNALAPIVAVGDDIESPAWLGEGGPYEFPRAEERFAGCARDLGGHSNPAINRHLKTGN